MLECTYYTAHALPNVLPAREREDEIRFNSSSVSVTHNARRWYGMRDNFDCFYDEQAVEQLFPSVGTSMQHWRYSILGVGTFGQNATVVFLSPTRTVCRPCTISATRHTTIITEELHAKQPPVIVPKSGTPQECWVIAFNFKSEMSIILFSQSK